MRFRGLIVVASAALALAACGQQQETAPVAETVTTAEEVAAEAAAAAMPEEEVMEDGAAASEGEGPAATEVTEAAPAPVAATAPAKTAAAAPKAEAGQTYSATLVGDEQGDNYYVTVRKANGEEVTALCSADPCQGWLDAGALPANMVGKRVTVTETVGQQVDGSGDVMGDFPAFTSIVIQ